MTLQVLRCPCNGECPCHGKGLRGEDGPWYSVPAKKWIELPKPESDEKDEDE